MASLWEQTWEHPGFPAPDGDLSTDVLIIGGGMAGVLCAYLLHRAGVDYALVEAGTLCGGITRNTTAKITRKAPTHSSGDAANEAGTDADSRAAWAASSTTGRLASVLA